MSIEKNSFVGLLILVTLVFVAIIADFLLPIFWAATLAVLFRPVYVQLVQRLNNRRSLASLFTLLLICLTVLLPAWFVSVAVINEAAGLYARLQSGEIDLASWVDWLRAALPQISDFFERYGMTADELKSKLSSFAVTSSQFVGSLAVSTGQNVARFAVMFVLMLYLLFFIIRDGDDMLELIIIALPLGDERERALLQKFAEVSRAAIKGTLVIAIVQGALGGIIFAILGIDAAVFWGVVMAILSLVPVVGAFLVWFPASIMLFAGGQVVSALILFLFGAIVISLVDNLLRPLLVGRDTRMPDYLILLSTLGGLTVFGASGIVIGPIVAALFLASWVMFAEEHAGTRLSDYLNDEE